MTMKHDAGKRRWSLIPWRELGQVVDVLTFGAQKYTPDNWKTVPNGRERYYDAACRHVTARALGDVYDEETGLPHLAHAVCCLLFYMWFDTEETYEGRQLVVNGPEMSGGYGGFAKAKYSHPEGCVCDFCENLRR